MNREPARLLSGEASNEMSAMLRSADADASDAAVDRVRARLEGALGAAFAHASRPPMAATKHAPRALRAGKWLGVAAILGLGALWFAAPARRAQPSAAPMRPALVSTPAAPPAAPGPEPRITPAAVAVEASPQLSAAKPPARAVERRTAHPAPGELGLAEELKQLRQIRLQLATSPARALAAAAAQDRRFAHGTLGAERELLRIDALLRLGRVADAHALAARALATPGDHPYRAQIEALLARK
jgi:hypothetical protein